MLTVVLSIACIIFAMLTVVLLTACLIFAIGWLKNKIGLLTLTAHPRQTKRRKRVRNIQLKTCLERRNQYENQR